MAVADPNDVYLLRPLNNSPPSAEDKRHSAELEKFLRDAGLYEPDEDAYLRQEVLGLFYELTQTWVKGVCRKKNLNVEDARAHVYTFGSYRLGVHGPGADMDTLVVGPRYVLRDSDFFGSDKHCLQYMLSQTPDITDIQPVPDAFVPMIGIKYKGVQIDILYASLAMQTLPEQLDLSSHAVLRGCDEPTVRALNGCRVTDTMLKLVPRQDVFRTALRAVKHWASLRGISSNVTGYLGGVNLAIMVAKICQLYPRAEASTVLLKFFILLKAWPWPRAIHLRIPEEHSLGLPVWDPRPGTRDSLALMPVITPAYPAMNSLYNVQRSTLEVMTEEFAGAADVCTSFLHCPPGKPIEWGRLFTPVPFFTQHSFYIQLEVSADSEGDLVLWDGWVSSRIRRLVRNLEDHVRIRPYPKAQKPPPELLKVTAAKEPDTKDALVDAKDAGKDADACAAGRPRLCYYIGIDKRAAAALTAQQLLPNGQVAQLPPHAMTGPAGAPAGKVDLKQPCTIFVNEVTAWPAKRPGMELRVNVLKRAALPSWLPGVPQRPPAPALPAPPPAAVDSKATKAATGVKRAASGEPSNDAASAAPAAAPLAQQPAKRARANQAATAATAVAPAKRAVAQDAGPEAAAATAGASQPPPAKRAKAAQAAPRSQTQSPALTPEPHSGESAAAASAAPAQTQAGGEPATAAPSSAGAVSAGAGGESVAAVASGSAAPSGGAVSSGAAATDATAVAGAGGGGEGLSQEAAQQLAERASQADERAAVQESQLHNTGRDMGDWLGVDHGVALTGVQGSPSASS
ncbi:hypothetical protein HXX76_008729 [Chlamydomonas incerta]|uniref:polynucleotide adenylyltransferase n=1 Tax=Chlamydomonas incerta TaxID=51695 RepID=A0A835VXJ2_CHLIN|nr:hypothetical protein HXX76_008729 [Chlamydomonas incerta]|eukprot:KAG2433002.1 hypothetical protein HXX76_008729 [Chlamydomonas incerta]